MTKRKATVGRPVAMPSPRAAAAGRRQGAAVRRYLGVLERRARGDGGRQLHLVEHNVAQVDEALSRVTDSVRRLRLAQTKADLVDELERARTWAQEVDEAEEAFIAHAGAWAARHGVTRAVWRAQGVPVRVLDAAGVVR